MLTIQALAEAVANALADADEPKSGRIRAIPDARSIRYYTTLGLLERPAAMDGRTALYDERHVEQLVAIKRLQAEGLSLAEIQTKLHGITPKKARTKSTRSAFWKEEPAAPAPMRALGRTNEEMLVGIALGELTLLFHPARTIDEADVAELRDAAAPLLRVLEARGLIAPFEAERNPS